MMCMRSGVSTGVLPIGSARQPDAVSASGTSNTYEITDGRGNAPSGIRRYTRWTWGVQSTRPPPGRQPPVPAPDAGELAAQRLRQCPLALPIPSTVHLAHPTEDEALSRRTAAARPRLPSRRMMGVQHPGKQVPMHRPTLSGRRVHRSRPEACQASTAAGISGSAQERDDRQGRPVSVVA